LVTEQVILLTADIERSEIFSYLLCHNFCFSQLHITRLGSLLFFYQSIHHILLSGVIGKKLWFLAIIS